MVTKEQLEEAISALIPILEQIKTFERQYGNILMEYRKEQEIANEADRTDAAIKMIRKYSNL